MKEILGNMILGVALLTVWAEAGAEFLNLETGIWVIRTGAIIALLIIIGFIVFTAKADVKESAERNHEIYEQRKLQDRQQFLSDYANFVISKHK